MSDYYGLIAVQGPESHKFVKEILGDVDLKPFSFKILEYQKPHLLFPEPAIPVKMALKSMAHQI